MCMHAGIFSWEGLLYVCACKYVGVSVCTCVRMYVYTKVHVYVGISAAHMYGGMYECMYLCMRILILFCYLFLCRCGDLFACIRYVVNASWHIYIGCATHATTHCNTPQQTATHCNTLVLGTLWLHRDTKMWAAQHALQRIAIHLNTLQHTATRCNTLQHTVTCRYTLQHTATQQWLFPVIIGTLCMRHNTCD